MCKLFSIHIPIAVFPINCLRNGVAPQIVPHVIHLTSPDNVQVSPMLPQPYPQGLKRLLSFRLAAVPHKP